MASPESDTASLLFCRVCRAVFTKPKLLACLHSVCSECLATHAAQSLLQHTTHQTTHEASQPTRESDKSQDSSQTHPAAQTTGQAPETSITAEQDRDNVNVVDETKKDNVRRDSTPVPPKTVPCPVCQLPTPLPPGGVASLADNTFLDRLCREYVTAVQDNLRARAMEGAGEVGGSTTPPQDNAEIFTQHTAGVTTRVTAGVTTTSRDNEVYAVNQSEPTRESEKSTSGLGGDQSGDSTTTTTPSSSTAHVTTTGTSSRLAEESAEGVSRPSSVKLPLTRAVSALESRSRVQHKTAFLQGEALRLTYAIEEVNQHVEQWHRHRDDLRRDIHRRCEHVRVLLNRLERGLTHQLDSQSAEDAMYGQADQAKTDLRSRLKAVLHEVSVLTAIQELAREGELEALGPSLLEPSPALRPVVLTKQLHRLTPLTAGVEDELTTCLGSLEMTGQDCAVFTPEGQDFSSAPTAPAPRQIPTVVEEEAEESPALPPPTQPPARKQRRPRDARRHKTDLGLQSEEVKEFLQQFKDARESLKDRRREILRARAPSQERRGSADVAQAKPGDLKAVLPGDRQLNRPEDSLSPKSGAFPALTDHAGNKSVTGMIGGQPLNPPGHKFRRASLDDGAPEVKLILGPTSPLSFRRGRPDEAAQQARPVRRAVSNSADKRAKIEFLRENWHRRKEILKQTEGFVSPDSPREEGSQGENDVFTYAGKSDLTSGKTQANPNLLPNTRGIFSSASSSIKGQPTSTVLGGDLRTQSTGQLQSRGPRTGRLRRTESLPTRRLARADSVPPLSRPPDTVAPTATTTLDTRSITTGNVIRADSLPRQVVTQTVRPPGAGPDTPTESTTQPGHNEKPEITTQTVDLTKGVQPEAVDTHSKTSQPKEVFTESKENLPTSSLASGPSSVQTRYSSTEHSSRVTTSPPTASVTSASVYASTSATQQSSIITTSLSSVTSTTSLPSKSMTQQSTKSTMGMSTASMASGTGLSTDKPSSTVTSDSTQSATGPTFTRTQQSSVIPSTPLATSVASQTSTLPPQYKSNLYSQNTLLASSTNISQTDSSKESQRESVKATPASQSDSRSKESQSATDKTTPASQSDSSRANEATTKTSYPSHPTTISLTSQSDNSTSQSSTQSTTTGAPVPPGSSEPCAQGSDRPSNPPSQSPSSDSEEMVVHTEVIEIPKSQQPVLTSDTSKTSSQDTTVSSDTSKTHQDTPVSSDTSKTHQDTPVSSGGLGQSTSTTSSYRTSVQSRYGPVGTSQPATSSTLTSSISTSQVKSETTSGQTTKETISGGQSRYGPATSSTLTSTASIGQPKSEAIPAQGTQETSGQTTTSSTSRYGPIGTGQPATSITTTSSISTSQVKSETTPGQTTKQTISTEKTKTSSTSVEKTSTEPPASSSYLARIQSRYGPLPSAQSSRSNTAVKTETASSSLSGTSTPPGTAYSSTPTSTTSKPATGLASSSVSSATNSSSSTAQSLSTTTTSTTTTPAETSSNKYSYTHRYTGSTTSSVPSYSRPTTTMSTNAGSSSTTIPTPSSSTVQSTTSTTTTPAETSSTKYSYTHRYTGSSTASLGSSSLPSSTTSTGVGSSSTTTTTTTTSSSISSQPKPGPTLPSAALSRIMARYGITPTVPMTTRDSQQPTTLTTNRLHTNQ